MRNAASDQLTSTESLLTLLGTADFVSLVERFGGSRIIVPTGRRLEESFLAKELGIDLAEKLSKEFGGSLVRIPLGVDQRIIAYVEKGYTNPLISRLLGQGEQAWRWSRRRLNIEIKQGPSSAMNVILKSVSEADMSWVELEPEVAAFLAERFRSEARFNRAMELCVLTFGVKRSPTLLQAHCYARMVLQESPQADMEDESDLVGGLPLDNGGVADADE